MEWFFSDINATVRPMHPSEIRPGMRLPAEVVDMRPSKTLIPVWDIQYHSSGSASMYGGSRYTFRLNNGEWKSASSADRVYASPEILPENLPPHTGVWVTNVPFGFYDKEDGELSDRHWYEGSRALEKHETEDGRVYRLLAYKDGRSYWVCRWDHGKKWLGPVRYYPEGAYKQWDAIVEGAAW